MTIKTAVVVGGLGVIGRYIVERLSALPDWQVVGLSRRNGLDRDRVRYISVDLLDPADTQSKLAGLGDATHVFYCAFQAAGTQAADYARAIDVNRDMLVHSIYQVTESTHMASAALWAATEERSANQAYNITNGDYFRWANLWPRIAQVFEMPHAEPQTISLGAHMADKAPLWDAMVKKHGLKPHRNGDIVAWPFGDYVFGCDWDVMTSTTKARLHGFHDVVDSEDMFVRLLGLFRAERIVP